MVIWCCRKKSLIWGRAILPEGTVPAMTPALARRTGASVKGKKASAENREFSVVCF